MTPNSEYVIEAAQYAARFLAAGAHPELGAAYLGTQGDEWDAQKDSALAFGGAILSMAFAWFAHRGVRGRGEESFGK